MVSAQIPVSGKTGILTQGSVTRLRKFAHFAGAGPIRFLLVTELRRNWRVLKQDLEPGNATPIVLAHSHGGNVALRAMTLLEADASRAP